MAVHTDASSLASLVRRVNVAARCAAPTGRRRRVRIELDVAVKRTPGRYKLATGSKNGNVSFLLWGARPPQPSCGIPIIRRSEIRTIKQYAMIGPHGASLAFLGLNDLQ